jgi:hypothetical protein
MFKERLKLTMKVIGIVTLTAFIGIGLIYPGIWIREATLFESTQEIILYGILFTITVILTAMFIEMLRGLCQFLKWLFIEPYREYIKNKSK